LEKNSYACVTENKIEHAQHNNNKLFFLLPFFKLIRPKVRKKELKKICKASVPAISNCSTPFFKLIRPKVRKTELKEICKASSTSNI
jgi:hypothetical protein